MNSAQSFSSWFRHQLKRREWNQSDFARASDLNPTTVSAWYRGIRVPDPASCETIATTFGHGDSDLVLIMAGHKPDTGEFSPSDPRFELLELIRGVDWNDGLIEIAKGTLGSMPRVKKG